jgi:osmotically-inducible protein OsmY
MQTVTRFINLFLIMALLGMILAMTGCSKTDDNGQTVGQQVDKAIEKGNEQAAKAGREIDQAASKAGEKIDQGADKAQSAARDAAAVAKEKAGEVLTVVDDSAITASVKADLLKDPKLSSQKVDVRTQEGQVTLTGSVSDAAAKQRASEVAAAVSGVQKVNNELQVAAAKGRRESGSA